MSYLIGSFNIRDFNFSKTSGDGDAVKRDFSKIAEIIIKENFDIVAIQEVNAEIAIKHLTDVLNRRKNYLHEWDYDFSGKAATTINDPEGYGFIWNTKRFHLLELQNKNNPTYYNYAGGKSLLRPPYYARFTTRGIRGGSNFELRIVNIHIQDSKDERERIEEFNILVKQVLPRICDHQEVSVHNEIMPAYTFLAGDYNLRLDKGDRAIVRIESITPTNYTGRNRYFKTVQEEKTSLRQAGEQETIDDCYANNYDHFTYEMELIRKLFLDTERVEPLTKYFPEEGTPGEMLGAYRKKVSDHVPIKMSIDLKGKENGREARI